MNLRNLHKDNHPDLFPEDKIKLTFPTNYADIVERVSSVNANAYGKTRNFFWGYRDWETDRKSTRLNSSH